MADHPLSHSIFNELAPNFAQIEREHEVTEGPPRFQVDHPTEDWIASLPDGSPLIKLYGQLVEEDESIRDRMRAMDIDDEEYDILADTERQYAQHRLKLFSLYRNVFGATMNVSSNYHFSVESAAESVLSQEAHRLGCTVAELEIEDFVAEIAEAYVEQEQYEMFLHFEQRDRETLQDFFEESDSEVHLPAALRQIDRCQPSGPVQRYLYRHEVYVPEAGSVGAGTLDSDDFEPWAEDAPEDEFDLLRSWLTMVYCDALEEKLDLFYKRPVALARAESRTIDRLEQLIGRPERNIAAADFVHGLTTSFLAEVDYVEEQRPETD